MALDKWDNEDFLKMKEIERELIDFLLPKIQNVNPLLVLYTLVRCARVFLRKGDVRAQRELLPVIHAYLDGKVTPPGADKSPLWTPGDRLH